MSVGADIEAVNPATGEVLERLNEQPPESLAEALDAVHARQAELKRWGDALEGELRRRLRMRGRALVVFGDWEVEARSGRESDWDAEALEAALRRLVDDGTLRAGELADVITRTPIVSKSKAGAVVQRLTGDARTLVEDCRTWKETRGKLTVTRSVELLPPEASAASKHRAGVQSAIEEAPSVDGQRSSSEQPTGSPGSPARAPAPAPALTPEELFR